ncbi:hypothetical protein [Kitasatospora viridis]|uniref:Uncharacterized protein n=1 Tax=Kitasatospora viridis TaxID=281105 RepID=A0A561SEP9_9ACTN|nr:hypothetical protein [Kitasatospora viridis]TWF73332.1 hypothetical protein FHX73_16483 [Kitasatospora viridis]
MDQVFTLAWQYVAGLVETDDLPMAAARLLADGLDSPALRDLAGRGRREDGWELEGLFRQAVAELGATVPDPESAERCRLRDLADRLAAGDGTPWQVAGWVWCALPAARTGPEREFLEAVGEEYVVVMMRDDHPEDFRAWEARVRAAAERFSRT